MADLTRAYTALRNADAAGDTEAVKKLTEYINSQSPSAASATQPKKENAPSDLTRAYTALRNADSAGDTEAVKKLTEYIKSQSPSAEKENAPSKTLMDRLTSAETYFGKGTTAKTPLSERLNRFYEAGTGGAALGGAGGFILGGPAGGLAGAVGGFFTGLAGEGIEEAMGAAGAGRGAQVAAGMVGAPVAGEAGRLLTKVGTSITHPTRAVGKILDELRPSETSERVTDFRARETQKARTQMAPNGLEPSAQAGKEIISQQAAREQKAQAWAKMADSTRLAAANQLRQTADKAESQVEEATFQGTGKQKPPSDLGTNIRKTIEGKSEPEYAQMSKEYEESHSAAMQSAAQAESKGQFWAATPEATKLKAKWEKIAAASEPGTRSDIRGVLNAIWPERVPIKNEWGEVTGYQPQKHLSAMGIDQLVRKLGDAGYKEVEGFKNVGRQMAKEMRDDIVRGPEGHGGFYDWSGLGQAKGQYAAALEKMRAYETQRGTAALGKQEGTDVFKVDADKLPKKFLGSKEGLAELTNMVKDPKKVSEFVQQHTHNELAGKNVEGIRKWMRDNQFLLNADPKARAIAQGQLNRLSSMESRALAARSEADIALQAKGKYAAAVEQKAKDWMNRIGMVSLKQDPHSVILNALNDKTMRGEKLKAISELITNNPQARSQFGDAVAYHLSTQSPNTILRELNEITPALKGSGLITNAQILTFNRQAQAIVKASKGVPPVVTQGKLKALFSRLALNTAVAGAIQVAPPVNVSDRNK